MDKIIIGLVLGIIVCFAIYFDMIDMIMMIGLMLCMFELIYNYFVISKNTILLSGIIFIIIAYQIISTNFINITKLLIIVIISDIFQELFGKIFGKNKIGWISPNKTYEGYIGGYIGIIGLYFLTEQTINNFILLHIVYLFGVVGDLYYSYLKRIINIKDYSNILYSHGGILDRLDSFIFASIGYSIIKLLGLID
jgi:phosphatidate cytidylyltransferase